MMDFRPPAFLHLNGALHPVDAPVLPAGDVGLLRGYGIFDYFQVRNRTPLFLDDYLNRFFTSASILGLETTLSRSGIAESIQELLSANSIADCGARLVLTGGLSPDGFSPGTPNFLILLHPPAQPHEAKGGTMLTHEHLRELPEAKTTNYLTGVTLKPRLTKAGAADPLYHHAGRVLEGARSNVFVVTADGVLATSGRSVLRGITRMRVLRLARGDGRLEISGVEERDVAMEELRGAREVFLTSSSYEVLPITQIDEQPVGDGSVGPVARRLLSLVRQDTLEYLDGA